MPTYEYRCTECDHDFEVFQKFSDAPLTQCPVCRGRLRKVFSPVGIVFKGSGFYSTDSHRSGSTAASLPASPSSGHRDPGHPAEAASSVTSDTAPAETSTATA
jgi:putative FmdB family regulatory protein